MEGCEVQFSTHHSLFRQLGSLTASAASITTKSTRLSQTIHSYKEHRRLVGCQAHITVRTITLYPDFTLSEVEAAHSLWKQKERKEETLTQLQNVLTSGENIETTTKYGILLPTEEAHHSFHKQKEQLAMPNEYIPSLLKNSVLARPVVGGAAPHCLHTRFYLHPSVCSTCTTSPLIHSVRGIA